MRYLQVTAIIESFQDYLISELNYSSNTVESYIRDMCQFVAKQKIINLEDIEVEKINDYLTDFLQEKKLKMTSIARKSASLVHFCKFLVYDGFLDDFPIKKIIKISKESQKLPQVYDYAQIMQIISFYRQKEGFEDLRTSLIVGLLFATGLRVSELIKIKKKDFFFDREMQINFLRIIGKGSKERLVPVHDFAMDLVGKFVEHKNCTSNIYLLENCEKHLTRQRISQILWEIEQDLGIKLHPHQLRHSFATHFLQKSQNIRMVQKVLGHTSLSSTQIYTHIEKSDLKKNLFAKHPWGDL